MSNREKLAEHGTGLCVWALVGLGVSANLTGAASLAVVAAIAYGTFKKHCKDRCISATEAAAKALTPQHGMPERGIVAALELIKSLPKPVAIDLSHLKDADKRNAFPDTLYDHIFAGVYVPKDDGVEKALRIVIAQAYEVLRLEDDVHKVFTQEALKELERLAALSAENEAAFLAALDTLTEGQDLIAAAVQDTQQTAEATQQSVEAVRDILLEETFELRAKLHSAEKFATALAFKYAEDFPDDLDAALKTLKSALERGAEATARNALPSNVGEAVDAIVAEVERLKQDGQMAEAYAKVQEERAKRKAAREQQNAADSRVLDLVIEHATYAQDAEGYAQAHLEQIQLDSPSAEDTFERLRDLWHKRYQEGLRLGTPFALTSAAGLARSCIEIAPTPNLRAMAQDDLAGALSNQGSRTEGAKGAALLSEAVEAYHAALHFLSANGIADECLKVMQNLGVTLKNLGQRTPGNEGIRFLDEAIRIYREVDELRNGNAEPVLVAETMTNLAVALDVKASRTSGDERLSLLTESVGIYREALSVFPETEQPFNWAQSSHNLAIALKNLGSSTLGDAGKAHLDEAKLLFKAVLRVRTKAQYPVDRAMTLEGLALLELACAEHDTATDRRLHLDTALAHIEDAIETYDLLDLSLQHANATRLRDRILTALQSLPPSSSS